MKLPLSLLESLLRKEGLEARAVGGRGMRFNGIGLSGEQHRHESWLHLADSDEGGFEEDLCYLFLEREPQNPPRNYLLVCGDGKNADREAYNALNEIFYRFSSWDSELMEAVNAGADVDRLIDLSLGIFSNPLTVYDATMELIGYGGFSEQNRNRYYMQVGDRWFLHPATMAGARELDLPTLTGRSSRAFFDYVRKPWHLECPITTGGRALGLLIIPMSDEILSQDYLSLAERLAWYLAQVLDRELRAGLDITDLLIGRTSDLSLAQHYCTILGWNPDGDFQVVVASSEDAGFEPDADVDSRTFDLLFGGGFTSIVDGRYVTILYERQTSRNLARDERLAERLRKNRLRAACSLPFRGIAGVSSHYEQAVFALEHSGESFSGYETMLARHLYMVFTEGRDGADYLHPAVGKLAARDSDGTLRQTLLAYLMCGNSHAHASQRLSIHKSTLKYRLDKIADILSGEDYLDDALRLEMLLSLEMSLMEKGA